MTETIVLGGGCFWCLDAVFRGMPGIVQATVGYCNGHEGAVLNYPNVCSGSTGAVEVLRLVYDPATQSVHSLLTLFFKIHDPTQRNRQGADVGTQYRSGIYLDTAAEIPPVQALINALPAVRIYAQPIVTEVLVCQGFVPAEEYHQNYYYKNPEQGYCQAVIAPKLRKLETLGITRDPMPFSPSSP